MSNGRESASVFDVDGTLERMGGDYALLREMAGFLAEDAPRLLTRLDDSVRAEKSVETERAAHTLKGLVSMFGAAEAEQQALAVELAARQGNTDTAGSLLPELCVSVRRVVEAVRQHLAEHGY